MENGLPKLNNYRRPWQNYKKNEALDFSYNSSTSSGGRLTDPSPSDERDHIINPRLAPHFDGTERLFSSFGS